MCGIYGFYSDNKNLQLKNSLTTVQALLSHRGPDSKGIYENNNVGLTVLRLSIVDIEGSVQPLYNEDSSIVVIYNGMIYNYKELRADLQSRGHNFRTDGDGEVILHLYEEKGLDCFQYLHGMFAIALYNLKKNIIILARDQIGIKPLYFYLDSKSLLFSSEIKSFIKTGLVKDDIDPVALSLYLSYNYIPGKETIYKNIYKLLPGHSMKIGNDFKPLIKRFWNINIKKSPQKTRLLTVDEMEKDIGRILNDSIDKHMQSDVEVGCFLSGGLDSSSLVHLLHERNRKRIKTFSIGYNNKYYDELRYARVIAKRYDTEHREIVCTPDDVTGFLDNLSEIGDSPVADQSCVSTFLLSKLASKSVKVCLSGEGADELFLGYPTHYADFLYPFFSNLPPGCINFVEKVLKLFPSSDKKLSFDYKLLYFLRGLRLKDPLSAHVLWRVIFSEAEKERLIKTSLLSYANNVDIKNSYFEGLDEGKNTAELCANADLNTWLPCNNLLRTDIFSMRNSLEVRVPFLYLPLVEYLFKLPFRSRFNILSSKYLLKKVMRGKVDSRIIKRKKQGWHMPLAPWLKSELFNYTYDIFNSRHRLFDSFLNRKYCMDLLIQHKKQKENNSFKIWSILVLLKQVSP